MSTPPPPPPGPPRPPAPPRAPAIRPNLAARAEAIFDAVLDLPEGQREGFLVAECGEDDGLLQRVRALLAARTAAPDFLEVPPLSPEIEAELARLKPEEGGEMIGPYKLREQIGEGGFGSVWVADQEKPVRRRVALKIIKMGMDTKEVIARFEQERQALAMMDHPNIAKVLDAGATQYGRPFFVMELVRGVKITDYCDDQQLSTQERIELFITVCQAVQHAHQKGIIHRDLKPSNILVTINDGEAVPKVIDFGVAKATQGRLTDATVYTQFQQMIGTPLYMSPEQAELTSLDIDTRSDIYALGVLLYELLTGHTPIDQDTMARIGMDEMRRMIREVDPPRPSMRVKTLDGAELTTAAKRRHTDPAKLPGALRGDLDWIVMKCLEKDRRRRYDTANGLALDLQRHLKNEVVIARPPTAGYLLGKLIRRHRLAFAASAAIAASLVLGMVATTWMYFRESDARKQTAAERDAKDLARKDAEDISKFLGEVFKSPDPMRDGREIKVVELLDKAAENLDTDLAGQPAQRAKLQATLGRTYYALGLNRQAIPLQEKARDYHLATSGPESPATGVAMQKLANSYYGAARKDDALKLREEVLTLRRKMLRPEDPATLSAMNDVAISYDAAGRKDEALKMREEVLPLIRKVSGPEDPSTLGAMTNLASSYRAAGRLPEAVALQEEALAVKRRVLPPSHPHFAVALENMAGLYMMTSRNDEAIKLREEVLALRRKVLGSEHPSTLGAMTNLAISYGEAGRLAEGLALEEQALALKRRVLPPNHPFLAAALENMAQFYEMTGRKDEAAKLRAELEKTGHKDKALKLREEVTARKPEDTMLAMGLAVSQMWFGRDADYAATVLRMLDWAKDATKPDDLERVAKLASLRPIDDTPTREAALALARKAVDLGKENQAGMPWYQMTLGMAEYRSGHDAAAVEALTLAEAAVPSLTDERYRAQISGTAGFYRVMSLSRQGKPAEARTLFNSTEAAMKPLPADDQNALADGANHDDLILWLACKEAKALLAQPGPPAK